MLRNWFFAFTINLFNVFLYLLYLLNNSDSIEFVQTYRINLFLTFSGCWGHFLLFYYYYIYIHCSLFTQTFGYRGYGCWVDALITWSPLKFIILRYSFGFQCHVLYNHFSPSVLARGQLQFVLETFNTFSEFGPSKEHRLHKYYAYCNSVNTL